MRSRAFGFDIERGADVDDRDVGFLARSTALASSAAVSNGLRARALPAARRGGVISPPTAYRISVPVRGAVLNPLQRRDRILRPCRCTRRR